MPRGHCLDYWRKWKREHNFCGLRPQDAKENDKYLDLVEKMAGNGAGLDGDFILEHFTAGAARPLLRCKDDKAYEYALNYVIKCLKREEDITGGDLQATIDGFLGKKKKTAEESTQMRTSGKDAKPELETEPQIEKPDPAGKVLADRLKDEPHEPENVPNQTAAPETRHEPAVNPPTEETAAEAIAPLPADASMKDRLARDEKLLKMTRQNGNSEGFQRASGAASPTIPSSQGIPRITRAPPNTLGPITFDDSQWNTLRQLVRASQAESLEEAVKFCVDEVGRQAGGQ